LQVGIVIPSGWYSCLMQQLSRRVKALARETGADLVGVTDVRRLADAPPSGDPTYLLPSCRSVIAFAVALPLETARRFIAKQDWSGHCGDRKQAVRRLYTVGDALASTLRTAGYEALNVEINNNYRPEPGAADVTEMTEFHPDFSHRYAAVAAGVGRLGWSGNLLTQEYGALVELGSVLTSAALPADPVLEENPCDGCRICSVVCPVGMIHGEQTVTVTVAGVTEEIASKRPNTCCWIGCTGYEGLSPRGTWSNWSPYRLGHPLPEDRTALDALCVRLQRADPQMQRPENSLADYRKAVFDPDWFYYTVCGFCRSVCWPERADRRRNRSLLFNSGVAALGADGWHVVADGETEQLQTPFGVQVVVPRGELASKIAKPAGRWPLDQEVLAWLSKRTR
jgi:epoxyqueuosine reductase